MRFAYVVFLALYCLVIFIASIAQTGNLCKANTKKDVAINLITLLFFLGLLAQLIADGIRVIGD